MRSPALLLLLAVAPFALGACDESPPDSPRAAFEALREALREGDGERIFELQDSESRGVYRQRVGTLKAQVERGDDMDGLLAGLDLTAEGVRAATERELIAHFMTTRSVMALGAEFLATAEIVEETADGPDAASIKLAGPDGEETRLFFRRENGAWVLDAYRGTRRR